MSIRKKGANTWQIMVHLGRDKGGRQIRRYHTFHGSKREALREDARLQHTRDAGMYVEPSKLTLTAFMERWLKDFARLKTSERTYQGYSDLVRLHVDPCLGSMLLSKLRPVQLQQFYADQLERGRVEKTTEADETTEKPEPRGLAPQTVRNLHNVLHQALKTAVQWSLLAVNPADAVTPPRVVRHEQTALDRDHTLVLLKACEGTRLHVPVLLALATGARRGEILALRWQDLDLEARTVTIRRSLSETRDGLSFKETKSNRPRVITLPAFAMAPLKQHRHDQREQRILLRRSYQDNDLVVCSWDGRPWAPSLLTGAFGDLIRGQAAAAEKKAGETGTPADLWMQGVHFHTLRHTHISQLLMQGVPLKVASARAGHASVSITADIYGHLLPGADEQAAAQLDTFLSTPPAAQTG